MSGRNLYKMIRSEWEKRKGIVWEREELRDEREKEDYD